MKTVRFTHVVKRCGRPQVHTLWVAPEKDAELTRARKADRVMTIEAGGRSGKSDTGYIGFDPKRLGEQGQLLIFPKSLKAFEGARVVGIKFELVDQPKRVRATARAKPRKTPPKRSHPRFQISAKPAGHVGDEPPEREEAPAFNGKRSPQRERPPPKPAPPPRAPKSAGKSGAKPSDSPLLREVHAAIDELEHGKAVAAYKRLLRAVAEEEDRGS